MMEETSGRLKGPDKNSIEKIHYLNSETEHAEAGGEE
jgi:hypothetical protein